MLNRRKPLTILLGLGRLFRFELPFTAGVCVILGELLALGRLPPLKESLLGFSSVFLLSASALILNDYFDLEIDRVNAPQRPLPSGLVTGREVVLLSILVTLLGWLAAWLIRPLALLVAVPVWLVGFLYNWRFKQSGLWGNLMVSFSVGMTFIYGGVAAGAPFVGIIWLFGALVFLVDLGEEIAGDAMDVTGDRIAGSRSLAVRLGAEQALRISAAVFALVILSSFLPFVLGWFAWIYLLPLAIMDVVILYSTVKLLDLRIADRRRYIRWIYLSGLAALVAFIIIRVID